MTMNEIEALCDELRDMMRKKLGVRGRTWDQSLRKAGRLLPKRMRAEGGVLADAEMKAGHPKLAAQINARAVKAAHKALKAHLKTIDPKDRRYGHLLDLLGSVTFNLLLLGVLIAALIWWRSTL